VTEDEGEPLVVVSRKQPDASRP